MYRNEKYVRKYKVRPQNYSRESTRMHTLPNSPFLLQSLKSAFIVQGNLITIVSHKHKRVQAKQSLNIIKIVFNKYTNVQKSKLRDFNKKTLSS